MSTVQTPLRISSEPIRGPAESPGLRASLIRRPWIPASRAERLIAVTRCLLATASLIGTWIDPLTPAHHVGETWILLQTFFLYSVGLLAVALASRTVSVHFLIATHVTDLLFFTLLNALTHGPASPFFVYFVFSLLCGILRFGRRGTIATAACATAGFVGSVAWVSLSGWAPDVDLNYVIIRGVYLVVIAGVFVYLVSHQERIRRDLAAISTWPRASWNDEAELIDGVLRHLVTTFGSGAIAVVYAHFGVTRGWIGLQDQKGFLTRSLDSNLAGALLDAGGSRYAESSVLSDLAEVCPGMELVAAVPLEGDLVSGHLYLCDVAKPALEEISLVPIAARLIASRLDHFHLTERIRRGAVAEDRVRVSRDLHDSVLQSLTGAALQLKTVPRVMSRDPEQALGRIAEIEETILRGQRELRSFIEQLHPERREPEPSDLRARIASMADRFSRQWDLRVEYQIDSMIHLVSESLRQEVYSLVAEAVANAAKHAGASTVSIRIEAGMTELRIVVIDDGNGFSFKGRYDLAQMIALRRGPITLKERVASLRGDMILSSSIVGAEIDIRIPLRGEHA